MNRLRKALSVKVSSLVTTNLPFDEWTDVFGSERLTGALLDRLTHHVHILEMNGDSYRIKGSRQDATASRAAGRTPPHQGQPAGRHRILCTGHGARSHANAKIRVVSHYLGGTLSLRHSGMFCRRP